MNKQKLFLFSLLSGLLLIPAWYEWGHGLILLVAFIPLFFVEEYLDTNKHLYKPVKMFHYAALTFLIWNTANLWWIFNATFIGVVAAVIIGAFQQTIVFWLFHIVKRKLGSSIGYFSFIIFWILYEYIYINGELSNPWLTLGNSFIFKTRFVQWYDSTGVLGGSLWILLSNVLIFACIRHIRDKKPKRESIGVLGFTFLVISVPVIISFIKYHSYKEVENPHEVVVLQPNIDPYQKFISDPYEQTLIQLELGNQYVDSTTDYIVGPETSINNSIWLNRIEHVPDIRLIRSFLQYHPKLKYIVGAQCYEFVYDKDTSDVTAKKLLGTEQYYKSHNAAIQIDSTRKVQYYFKSMLVTGVEKMPYARFFRIMDNLILSLGGTTRGWAPQKERSVLSSPDSSMHVAPVICWESVYGEFINGYIKKGATYIFVITNDGWWGDTPGYRQHNGISRLRAIETRRSIARSANTGISSFIDQRGDVIMQLGWWQRGALKATINANDKLTFYVKHGDYIGRLSGFFGVIILAYLLVNILMGSKRSKKQAD